MTVMATHPDDIGEIICTWTPNGGAQVLAAPPVAVLSWELIDTLDRDTVDPWVVIFTDDVRYRIAGAGTSTLTAVLHRVH